MNDPVLSCVIPAPVKIEFAGEGKFRLKNLRGIQKIMNAVRTLMMQP